MKSTKQIMSEFKKTQALWKKYCDEGKCTKEEAIWHILDAGQKVMKSLMIEDPEVENMYQAVNYN
jgi:hypothetical protein